MTAPAPNPSAQSANATGMAALQQGDFASAERAFAAATAADPAAPGLWRNLAHARRELGDDAGERAALESALTADRTDFTAWLRLAQLHERLGDVRDALLAWGGVLQMAAGSEPLPPALAPLIAHGRAYCEAQAAQLRAQVDGALGTDVATLAPMEQRRVRAFLDAAAGARRIYVNECAGLHYPFLPADEFFDAQHFPWFAQLSAAAPAIRSELAALMADPGEALRPYVRQDAGTPANKWTALDNRLDWGAVFLWEYGAPNPGVLARCPVTAATLSALPTAHIPARAPNAFFSVLQPRTRIPPHTGVSNTRAIIHLPLIVPPGCGFRVGGEVREWEEGVPFAFDDTIEHEAWNDSDEPRAVLIFDVWNPHLTPAEQAMIMRFHATSDVAVASAG